jgi:hypothetical protein
MKKILLTSLAAVALVLGSGCASIIDGGSKTVQINSNPSGAKFTIYDKVGKAVDTQITPAIVNLEREHGYLSLEDYKLVFEAPGYYPGEAHVTSTLDGWYLGNILFGGLLGIIIVDPATGDMWTLSPRKVTCNLVPVQAGLSPEAIKAAQEKTNPEQSFKSSKPSHSNP